MNDKPGLPSAQDLDVVAEEQQAAKEGYLHRDGVAVDIAVDEIAGGPMDETISSRVRRVSDAHPGWSWNPGVWLAKGINKFCNLFQKDHGAKAEAGDLERAQKAVEIEKQALGIGAKNRRIG